MRDDFKRKLPSLRDKFKYFYPSMREVGYFPLSFQALFVYLSTILSKDHDIMEKAHT